MRSSFLAILAVAVTGSGVSSLKECFGQSNEVVNESFAGAGTELPIGWKVVAGKWQVKNGGLVANAKGDEAYITFGDVLWQNYRVEANVTFEHVDNPARWLSILVRATPDGSRPWSQVPIRFDTTASNGMEFAVRTASNEWSVRSKAGARAKSAIGKVRRLQVTVRGTMVQGYLDGELVVSSHLCVDRERGCVGFGASGCTATFDDVSVHLLPESVRPAASQASLAVDNVAHRGFSAIAPENTLSAIQQAVQAGADGCEFDVYACADGTVVLMHDKTLDRTTDGTGKVTELSLEALRKLDAGSWKGEQYKDEPVPTLVEALKLLKGTECQPVIEIKMEGISKKVVDNIRELDMVDQVAIIAFSQTVVREVRKLEPRIKCAWLYGKTLSGSTAQQADWLTEEARRCNASLLDLKYSILSPGLVTELKRRGFGVWTWTVNDPAIMRALRDWGVDSITTDHPDLLRDISHLSSRTR